ncbi:glycosyltransferase family 39 protein [Streptococcus suis]|nr:glycosyltransferase family 39 protein [Streptococcus suis]HEL1640546.1 glycosyltransferase family 39 protein [Streptococcus suis]
MSKLLKFGNSLFFVFTSLWLYFSIYFIFQYFNIDYTNLTNAIATYLFILPIIMLLLFHFRKWLYGISRSFFNFLNTHKIFVLCSIFLIQVIIAVTSVRLASADTTIVYTIATNKQFAMTTDYILINPNNYYLLLWMKLNYLLFGNQTIFALAIWNALFIDLSIYLLYVANRGFLNDKIADISFFLLVLIIGISPQHIYTYSDPIGFFFISLTIYLFVLGLKKNTKWQYIVATGISFAIANSFRPAVLVFLIAGIIVLAHQFSRKKLKMAPKKLLQNLILFFATFFLVTQATSLSLKHQNIVRYEENSSRTLLYYIDLGLTYSGNIHAEIPEEIRAATGENRNELIKADIKKRLDSYTFTSFVGHLYFKYYWMTNEGMFGWFQERVLNEDSYLDNEGLRSFQNWKIAKFVRSFIYVGGERYYFYAGVIQVIWVIVSLGLFVYTFYYTEKSYQLWMEITIFGALLFLLIFEAGRTRYLIQFLPAIVAVSSCGLYELATAMKRKFKG